MNKTTHTTQPKENTVQPPVHSTVTHTSANDRISIKYSERPKLKEVRCGCDRLICKASAGSIIEHKCRCGKTETYKVAA